jgi:hypothetical protein
MPRYFFDSRNGTMVIDDVGTECSSLDAAEHEAFKTLAGMAMDAARAETGEREFFITVREAEGGTPHLTAILTLRVERHKARNSNFTSPL